MLIVTVTITVYPEHRPEFLDVLLANARTSLHSEVGCLRFDVCEQAGSSDFFLYEQYVDDAAFDAHLSSNHYRGFDEKVACWIKEKRVARFSLVEG